MSCRPLSWFLVNVERYVKSLGSAVSSLGAGLDDDTRDSDTREVKRAEVNRGIGSSVLGERSRRGRNGLYGSGDAMSAETKDGVSFVI